MKNKYKSLSDYIDKNKRKIAKKYYKEEFVKPYVNTKYILSLNDKIISLINNYYAYGYIPNSVFQYLDHLNNTDCRDITLKNKLIKILKIDNMNNCRHLMWFITKQIAIIENHYTTQGVIAKKFLGSQSIYIRELKDFYAYLEKGILKKELEINLSNKTVKNKTNKI